MLISVHLGWGGGRGREQEQDSGWLLKKDNLFIVYLGKGTFKRTLIRRDKVSPEMNCCSVIRTSVSFIHRCPESWGVGAILSRPALVCTFP